MATLQAQDILDITASTLRDLRHPDKKAKQIAQTLQRYEVMSHWFRADRVLLDSGYGISRVLMNKLDETAADHVGLYEEDTVNVQDLLVTLNVDWVHAQTKWAFDVREMMMNTGSAQIVDKVEAQEEGAVIQLAEKLEVAGWSLPAAASTKLPWSIPYYCVYNATTGFTGAAPTGFTQVAGITPSSTNNWQNYSFNYTTANKADLIKKMRTAHRKIGFISPKDKQQFRTDGRRYRIYVNETTISNIEDLVTAQNENLGFDLAVMDDQAVFRRHAWVWVPYLDDNMASGSNPVYMIDLDAFYPAVLRGNFFRQSGPTKSPKQHNVFETFRDISYQHVCVNRRALAIGAMSDPTA